MRRLLIFLSVLLTYSGFATHNRAGEILYKRIAPFTGVVGGVTVQVYRYAFTIVKFTNDGANIADRCEDTLYFGDGTRGVAPRTNGNVGCNGCGSIPCGEIVINDPGFRVKKNVYYIEHTYAGPGTYLVYTFDPNRNADVNNIPNSVNLPFYLESLLIINNYTGANTSPTFDFDPTDRACLQKCFYHDPGAYDPDGDSLSFEISTSRGVDGNTVPGYFYPQTGGGVYGINAVTGLLTWCTPQFVGEYNLAFIVREWRKNTSGIYQQVGYVLRDMQVLVLNCTNNVPTLQLPPDTCVEAGTLLNQKIIVSDPDPGNFVILTGGGGAFEALAPAAVVTNTYGQVTYTANFNWQTTCDHIRQQPYISAFKAQDQQSPVKLTLFASYSIRVVPPSIKNIVATPIGSTMKITWNPSSCNPSSNPIVAYLIYRKNDCNPVVFDPCKTGVDPSLGYTQVGQTAGNVTTFIDNNGGNGLVVGQDYGYLVVAQYRDGSKSFASAQVCAKLKRDVPILLNVDVQSTSNANGSVWIRWDKPLTNNGNFDTLVSPGPYTFNLKHRAGNTGNMSTVFSTTQNSFYQLPTTYTHTGINTVDTDHEYEIEFLTGTVSVGSSQKATSVFLNATPGDRKFFLNWTSTTPWNNYKYYIYRNPGAGPFVLVDSTAATTYTDYTGIVNRHQYCYKVQSKGAYSDPTITNPLYNNSQEVCGTAVDNEAPCTPSISIDANCLSGTLKVTWNNVRRSCGADVIQYILYKKETIEASYEQVDIDFGIADTSILFDQLNLISNCFAIQSVDSSGNKSAMSPDYCVDNCPEFELPNIITLNGDGINDFFKAIKVRQIKEIDLYVYDRWGNLVYKTKDPYFKWDGISLASGKVVSEGTFFFICDVFEPRVTGLKKRNLKGYLQVTH